jgi:uncharacterized protein YjiS (DUF1127 family)
MADFYTPRTSYGTASAVNRFFGRITDVTANMQARRNERLTRQALSSLSDLELKDIGLSRGEIEGVARSHFIR